MSAETLRAAGNALALIRTRDPRAWPIAEALAADDVERCLTAVIDELASVPVPRVPSCGALAAWHGELRRGVAGQRPDRPSTWRLDALYRAAGYEAQAAEWDRQGFFLIGDRCRMQAVEVLAHSARQREAA